MEMEETKKLKQAMLDVLFEVKRICDKYRIDYFLIGGTLIGAIRHNGFIPWDDDIDIGMLRADYQRFIRACKRDLDSRYRLVLWNNEKDNPNIYAKIKIKGTTYIEKRSQNTKQSKEIFIDIFPFDNSPDNKRKAIKHGRKIAFYRRLLAMKCGVDFSDSTSFVKSVLNHFLKTISFFCSREKLYYKNISLCRLYEKCNTRYVVNACGTYNYMKERNARKMFCEFTEVPFESGMFKTIKRYDEYLAHIYGDYMALPPVSDRTSRHGLIKIDFGEYVPMSSLTT